jgi:hypothetical protein
MNKYLDAIVQKLEKGKPVPAPAAPPPQSNYTAHPFELFIPYATEEFARTFLHLLKVSPEMPPHLQQMIEVWLNDYDERLFDWLRTHYGPGVDRVADVITRQVMVAQQLRADSEAKAAVDNEISDLESQFKTEDGNGNNTQA